ncbi:MAG: hypothetical protein KJO47_00395 [Gammaproteobacteria bacterium]|nr:hypothetical protein [Gammaproteobacteria bacterium]NNC68337.1 hypothetical protein [Gammaproteobacteria bacterium]
MRNLLVSFKFTISALVAVLLIGLSTVVFGEANDIKEQDIAESTPECKMKAYTDPNVMAATMADPTKFMEFMALMSNPQTSINMMNCGMESSQWNEIIANMTNPTNMMNAMSQFMNPQMYTNWMTASMNPAFYQTAMNGYMNPALYMQWMTASMNPAFYSAPMKMADPKWQQETTAWMMNPANFQKMFEGMYNTAPVVADATSAK